MGVLPYFSTRFSASSDTKILPKKITIFVNKQKFMSRLIKVEDYFRKIVRSRLPQRGQTLYDYVGWFVRMRWFDYLGMGFLLLRIDATLTYWTGVYFAGHLSLVIMGLLGVVIVNPVMKMVTKCDGGHEMKRE